MLFAIVFYIKAICMSFVCLKFNQLDGKVKQSKISLKAKWGKNFSINLDKDYIHIFQNSIHKNVSKEEETVFKVFVNIRITYTSFIYSILIYCI